MQDIVQLVYYSPMGLSFDLNEVLESIVNYICVISSYCGFYHRVKVHLIWSYRLIFLLLPIEILDQIVFGQVQIQF